MNGGAEGAWVWWSPLGAVLATVQSGERVVQTLATSQQQLSALDDDDLDALLEAVNRAERQLAEQAAAAAAAAAPPSLAAASEILQSGPAQPLPLPPAAAIPVMQLLLPPPPPQPPASLAAAEEADSLPLHVPTSAPADDPMRPAAAAAAPPLPIPPPAAAAPPRGRLVLKLKGSSAAGTASGAAPPPPPPVAVSDEASELKIRLRRDGAGGFVHATAAAAAPARAPTPAPLLEAPPPAVLAPPANDAAAGLLPKPRPPVRLRVYYPSFLGTSAEAAAEAAPSADGAAARAAKKGARPPPKQRASATGEGGSDAEWDASDSDDEALGTLLTEEEDELEDDGYNIHRRGREREGHRGRLCAPPRLLAGRPRASGPRRLGGRALLPLPLRQRLVLLAKLPCEVSGLSWTATTRLWATCTHPPPRLTNRGS